MIYKLTHGHYILDYNFHINKLKKIITSDGLTRIGFNYISISSNKKNIN